jgi:tetratricopeptide (TPR) repeat protein
VFERDGSVYRTRPVRGYRTFNEQGFAAAKPANGLRLFCLGGSSAYGFPWGARESFAGVLGDVLAAAHPERHVESVNAAGLSYALHRVRLVAEEVVAYEPDVLILYSGHNEFVEPSFFEALKRRGRAWNRLEHAAAHSRLYSALRGLLRPPPPPASPADPRMFVRRETAIYSADQKRRTTDEFREGLRSIVRLAHARGVKVLLATVPANLREWRPLEREAAAALGPGEREAWGAALRAGRQRLEQGRWSEAEAELRRAAALDPDHAETRYLLGRVHEALSQWDAAHEAYRAACDLDPSPIRRLSGINDALRAVAREEGALLVDVERSFEERSEHGLIGFNLIEDYVHPTLEGHRIIAWEMWQAMEREGWLGPATPADRGLFERVVAGRRAEPDHGRPEWLFNQGAVLRHQGRTGEAIEKFRQALALSPEYEGALASLAQLLFDERQYDEVRSLLERLLRRDPESLEGRMLNGRLLLQHERAAEAAGEFRRVLALSPGDEAARFNLALSLLAAGQAAQAVAEFQALIAARPADAQAHHGLAVALREQGRLDEALAGFQEVVRLDPDHPAPRVELAQTLESLGRHDEALAHYRDALRVAPDQPAVHNRLALRLQAAGRIEAALEHYEAALRIDPDYLEARNNLGVLLHARGRLDAAVEQFRHALRLSPDHPGVHNNLGMVLQAQGKLELAIEHYRRALRGQPDSARAHHNLGTALRARGDVDGARRHLEQAARLDPAFSKSARSP